MCSIQGCRSDSSVVTILTLTWWGSQHKTVMPLLCDWLLPLGGVTASLCCNIPTDPVYTLPCATKLGYYARQEQGWWWPVTGQEAVSLGEVWWGSGAWFPALLTCQPITLIIITSTSTSHRTLAEWIFIVPSLPDCQAQSLCCAAVPWSWLPRSFIYNHQVIRSKYCYSVRIRSNTHRALNCIV